LAATVIWRLLERTFQTWVKKHDERMEEPARKTRNEE